MSFGYILGERTLLQNVEMMPPASILEYDIESAQNKISRYWDLREHLTPFDKPDSIILENISETFKTSVERRLSKNQTNWLSLSGGMDSRTIAAVIDVNNYPIKAVTSGVSGSYERKVTAKIAAAIGCEHLFYEFDEQQLVQSDEDMLELIREAIELTDGMRGSSSSAMSAFSARQRQKYNVTPVLTGHCGEIMKLDEAYNFAIRNPQDEAAISTDSINWAHTRMCKANALNFGDSNAKRISATAVNDNQWHHVIIEVDRDQPQGITFYVDGILSNGDWKGSHTITKSLSNSNDFLVGKSDNGYFSGKLEFLRISKGTLLDAKTSIEELYKWEFDGPFFKDFSGKSTNGARQNAGAVE